MVLVDGKPEVSSVLAIAIYDWLTVRFVCRAAIAARLVEIR